jgi:hypothetical protein
MHANHRESSRLKKAFPEYQFASILVHSCAFAVNKKAYGSNRRGAENAEDEAMGDHSVRTRKVKLMVFPMSSSSAFSATPQCGHFLKPGPVMG